MGRGSLHLSYNPCRIATVRNIENAPLNTVASPVAVADSPLHLTQRKGLARVNP